MTKDYIIKNLIFSEKYIKEDTFSEDFVIEAMNQYAKEIATKALLHHSISENVAYYTVEQLLKENQ